MKEHSAVSGVARDPLPSKQRQVMDAIKNFILERGLVAGDPMPTESELMEQLGISRNALREAIKALQALGFVEVRHGSGTYVGAVQTRVMQDGLAFRLQQSMRGSMREVRGLLQVREALEVGLASEVVRHYISNSTDQLRAIVDAMRAKAAVGEYFPDEDLAFHEALYRPLDNELVMDLLWVFWTTFHEIDPRLPGPHYTPADACSWHEDLLEALEHADVDLYRSRMRGHFDGVRIRLLRAEPVGPSEA